MIITGKRKLKLDKRFLRIEEGTNIILGIKLTDDIKTKLIDIGFGIEFVAGETVLPPSNMGPICAFNAEGKYIKHKDQPMETVYRQMEWTWEQWTGYGETETQSKIVDVPYKRYPRSFVPPPSVELSIVEKESEGKFIVAPMQVLSFAEYKDLVHTINIFLELFGMCEAMTEELEGYTVVNIQKLNWRILPPGEWPWEKLKEEVNPIIEVASPQKQIVINYRLETITGHNPDFVAIGTAGFSGYLIFGFTNNDVYILESLYTGNATYVFEEDWEKLSQLSKAEIIVGNLQKDRIIHREHWDNHINDLFD